jgi:hypothetical protein
VEGVRDELLCLRGEVGELIVSRQDRVCAADGRRRARRARTDAARSVAPASDLGERAARGVRPGGREEVTVEGESERA